MAAAWQISGDYFENCNCSVVCPCLVLKSVPLTSKPTQGVCDVALLFHIDKGSYQSTALDDLNVALAVHTPGPMAEGNWSVAAYIDERANEKQTEALGAIFTGAAGGPMAHFAPLIVKNLGVKKVPITYSIKGKTRAAEIPGILHMSVDPLPTAHPSGEMWANVGHPVSPEKLAFAVGHPEIRLVITGCAGTTPARTVTTRRSGGQALPDERIGSRSHFASRPRHHHRRARGPYRARLVRPRLARQ